VDTNVSDPQGLAIGGIFADALVEVRGEGGQITSKSVYRWSSRWIRQTGIVVAAEKDHADIEGSVPLASLNGTRVVIESTDWASTGDATIPVAAPAFASPGPFNVAPTNLASPPQANSFSGSTFYLRDAPSIIPSPAGCPTAKNLGIQGSDGGTSLLLTSGDVACFFTDPATSQESIPTGDWTASLDLS